MTSLADLRNAAEAAETEMRRLGAVPAHRADPGAFDRAWARWETARHELDTALAQGHQSQPQPQPGHDEPETGS